jgi:hypothetical protein
MIHVGWLATTAMIIVMSRSAVCAVDFPCPEPTKQVQSEIAGDVQGQAQGLVKLATAELKGGVQKTIVNLWESTPMQIE